LEVGGWGILSIKPQTTNLKPPEETEPQMNAHRRGSAQTLRPGSALADCQCRIGVIVSNLRNLRNLWIHSPSSFGPRACSRFGASRPVCVAHKPANLCRNANQVIVDFDFLLELRDLLMCFVAPEKRLKRALESSSNPGRSQVPYRANVVRSRSDTCASRAVWAVCATRTQARAHFARGVPDQPRTK
jgi:hypothetical protein